MSTQIKKIIPYLFVLVILAGLLSPIAQVGAQGTFPNIPGQEGITPATVSEAAASSQAGTSTTLGENALEENVPSCWNLLRFDMGKCLVSISYFVFYTIPSSLLGLSAIFFNAIIALALSSVIYTADFISSAWAVVRDLSNIFFILVLLYVAIKVILGFGGHDVKKTISQVIIMALLINFSMFFTKVVIDSSNILALVFYNKINVGTQQDGTTRTYSAIWSPVSKMVADRDISGGIYSSFDPTKLMTQEFFDRAKQKTQRTSFLGAAAYIGGGAAVGGPVGALVGAGAYGAKALFAPASEVPDSLILTIIIVSGLLMAFAAYAFFIAGISFVARIVELWILLIFAPFAFMSSSLPILGKVDRIGWEQWTHNLLRASFMAPIFMFFVYLIFLLVQVPLLKNLAITGDEQDTFQVMVLIILQSLIVLGLLMKATKYARESSGKLGEALIGGAKMAAGLAVGGAALGVAGVGRATVGAVAKSVQSSPATRRDAYTFKDTKEKWNTMNKANPFAYLGLASTALTGANKFAAAGAAELLHKTPIGAKMKEADEGYGHKTHATHILDAKMKAEFGHDYPDGAKYKDLTEAHQKIVKAEVDKDEMAKFIYGKLFKDLEAPQAAEIQARYKGTAYTDPTTGVTRAASAPERPIADEHGDTVRIAPTTATLGAGEKFKSDYFTAIAKSNSALGEFSQALRKGSYDIRNLPDMSAKTKGLPKFGVGTVALVAAGVRLALKKGGGIEYGKAQGDFLKDIGNTVTEALKNVKINVTTGGHGGGHGGDDHGHKEVKSVGH